MLKKVLLTISQNLHKIAYVGASKETPIQVLPCEPFKYFKTFFI